MGTGVPENFGRGYPKKKSREENGMGVGRKKMGGGRGVEHYPPVLPYGANYINPGYGLSLVDTLWNASSYRQPLEQKGNPMT